MAGLIDLDAVRMPPEESGDGTAAVLAAIPTFSRFSAIGDPERFVPLPDDWTVGVSDVVASGLAIDAGRYRDVNLAGAAVVSAVSNAIGTMDFPFLFAGDGASFAVGPRDAQAAADALAATMAWATSDLGLELRGGLVTVAELRRQGHDIRVARFAASDDVSYAMFSGGGLRWAEEQLKAGLLPRPTPPPPGRRPDLSGLSCRFRDIPSRHGVILSVIARPQHHVGDPRFRAAMAAVLDAAASTAQDGQPVARFSPAFAVSRAAVVTNARAIRREGEARPRSLLRAGAVAAFVAALFASRLPFGRFSPRRYLAEVVANSDFRKYDDGLMMTLDCSVAVADAIERLLAAAEQDGVVRFGLHRQQAATVTCVVPSAMRHDHVHFVDGASGGYAMAARALKNMPPPIA